MKSILVTFSFCLCLLVEAQLVLPLENDLCGVITTEGDITARLNRRKSLSAVHSSRVFAVTHHIFRNTAGDPNSIDVNELGIIEMMDRVNEEFSSLGIQFRSICTNYHNSNRLNDWVNSNDDLSPYQIDNTINIYYSANGFCGAATYPWTQKYFITLSERCYLNQSTPIHEFGHFLGLFHTFGRGASSCRTNELVDGSNCGIAGDYICDTPADPGFEVTSDCIAIPGDCLDENGDTYSPDIRNYLSYSPKPCRNRFSPQQKEEMKMWANSSEFDDFIYSPQGPLRLIGDSYFCTASETKTVLIEGTDPSKVSLTSSGNLIASKNGDLITVRPSSKHSFSKNNKAWIDVRYHHYCGIKSVRKEFWIAKPSIVKGPSSGDCFSSTWHYEVLPNDVNYNISVSGSVNYSISGSSISIQGSLLQFGGSNAFTISAGLYRKDCLFSNSLSDVYESGCSPISSELHVYVHDLSNEEIESGVTSNPNSLLKDLPQGVYVLTVINGSSIEKKLVVKK